MTARPGTARKRTAVLCAAARPGGSALADADFWYSAAAKLLAPVLLAADMTPPCPALVRPVIGAVARVLRANRARAGRRPAPACAASSASAASARDVRDAVWTRLGSLTAAGHGDPLVIVDQDGGGCEPGAPSGPPSKEAERDIPDDFLRLYQQAGAKHRIPWEILAGIGREGCDHGRQNNPACTPQPGASGPGSPNFVGASGPMQIGIGCAAGNIWAIRKVDGGGDGMTGAHDPADAIATAAIILIKDKGAPQDKPIDAYRAAVRAYNGAGPVAEAYADRVIADARLYSSGVNPVDDAAGCAPEDDLDISFDGPEARSASRAALNAPASLPSRSSAATSRRCPASSAGRSSLRPAPTTRSTRPAAASPTTGPATPPISAWPPTATATTAPSVTAS